MKPAATAATTAAAVGAAVGAAAAAAGATAARANSDPRGRLLKKTIDGKKIVLLKEQEVEFAILQHHYFCFVGLLAKLMPL